MSLCNIFTISQFNLVHAQYTKMTKILTPLKISDQIFLFSGIYLQKIWYNFHYEPFSLYHRYWQYQRLQKRIFWLLYTEGEEQNGIHIPIFYLNGGLPQGQLHVWNFDYLPWLLLGKWLVIACDVHILVNCYSKEVR